MSQLDEQLFLYAARSSPTEQDKQEGAVPVAVAALDASSSLSEVELTVIPKDSYPNGTNVCVNSNVGIAVLQRRVLLQRARW